MMDRIAEMNGMDTQAFKKTGGGKFWQQLLAYGIGMPVGAVQAGAAFVKSSELDIPALVRDLPAQFQKTYQEAGGNPSALIAAFGQTPGVAQTDVTGVPASTPYQGASVMAPKDAETALMGDARLIEQMLGASPDVATRTRLLARLKVLEEVAMNPALMPAYVALPPIGR
jgi:hypothetical protein